MARVTALYLEMLRPTKPGGKKTKRKITAILTGFEPRPFAIPTQTQSQFAFPEISSDQCSDFFRNFRKRRRPRVPFPYHLPPSVFHSNKTSEISKWEQMVRNSLGSFREIRKLLHYRNADHSIENFGSSREEIPENLCLPCEVHLFSRNSGKCCSIRHRKFQEIQTGIFRQMESDLGFESAPKFSNISS